MDVLAIIPSDNERKVGSRASVALVERYRRLAARLNVVRSIVPSNDKRKAGSRASVALVERYRRLVARLNAARSIVPSNDERKAGSRASVALVEQYRRLAARLSAAQSIKPFKLVMVTSALDGEGKSTVAAAHSLYLSALAGKKVLRHSMASTRNPMLDRYFQLDNRRGVSNVFVEMWMLPLPELYGQEKVTARSSSFVLGGSELDARTIGQRLGVDAVLEGGVRKSGDRLRVTVQLVDVAGGSPRWSHRFDGSLEQVFEIQDQIAASVATALKGMLSTEEREALRRPEAQVEAYEHFLRGRQHLHAQTSTSFDIAEREFLRAIEIDPGYAPAHAGLAQVYMWYVDWMGRGEPARQAADRASRRALELGPELAESHVARGAYLTSVCDYAGAEKEYREAIRLNPRSFDAHYLLARCGVHGGNHELAAEMFQRAAELRPEDFQCCAIAEVPLNRLGRFEEAARSRQEALRRIERHLELGAATRGR